MVYKQIATEAQTSSDDLTKKMETNEKNDLTAWKILQSPVEKSIQKFTDYLYVHCQIT